MIQLSARGAQFIGTFEGWRDKPYNDAANNATMGYGHLIHMGPVTPHDVSEWGTLSKPDGIRLLQSDAHLAETAIAHSITRTLPAWAWKWVEWKLGRAAYTGHAADPALRAKTGAPDTIPPWRWTFLHRFQ